VLIVNSSTKPTTRGPAATNESAPLDFREFLATIEKGWGAVAFRKKQRIFVQDDPSHSVFYIQQGKVRLTVVSRDGKEATIGILDEGQFFGESCLAGHRLRLCSATAMTDCSVMRIDHEVMINLLGRKPAFSELFLQHLLTKNIRYEADLVDLLFNSSEKRLARVLLLLAHFGETGKPEGAISRISHETLAEMVGTTRPRITLFMNKFRRLRLVHYSGHNGGLRVHRSLLSVVLSDG
jgi:CRP/FNR family cyclic AMP-dependent transcriptional regulator